MSSFRKIFAERLRELVGTGGRLEAALDARETPDRFLGGHADDQSRNALRVARTAAVVNYLADDVVVVECDVNRAGANPVRLISDAGTVR